MLEKKPETDADIDRVIYYTQRKIGNGRAAAWIYRQKCAKCKKGLMGKPRDSDGHVKIRAKEYVCPDCGYSVEKKEYEEGLAANIEYVCPKCGNKGEIQIPFKRKKVQGMDALKFSCGKCGETILVTKKMKEKGEPKD